MKYVKIYAYATLIHLKTFVTTLFYLTLLDFHNLVICKTICISYYKCLDVSLKECGVLCNICTYVDS